MDDVPRVKVRRVPCDTYHTIVRLSLHAREGVSTLIRFRNVAEAEANGYRRCVGFLDKDVTDDGFGYAYEARLDGRQSVTIRLTEVKNTMGHEGSFLEMMPLLPGVSEAAERARVRELAVPETDPW